MDSAAVGGGSARLSAEDVLELRSDAGEMAYRLRVMRLLQASVVSGLGPPSATGPQMRRVEGSVRLPRMGADGSDITGLVMFAVGGSGAGAMSDIRSKHANASAKSLLKEHPEASFIIVVVTHDPLQKIRDLADSCGSFVLADGSERPAVWVLTVADIVLMANRFQALRSRHRNWSWLQRLPLPWPWSVPAVPAHPLVAAA